MLSLSKLAPAKVGLKEKSGFLDLENRGFQTDQTLTHGTRRRTLGVAGKEGTSGQETRAFASSGGQAPPEWQATVHRGLRGKSPHPPRTSVGQCYTAAVFGSQAHNALFSAHGWWNRGCRRWGSLVLQEATGAMSFAGGRYRQVFATCNFDTFGNARYAAVHEWAKHTAAISNLS